jgi:hypothetical protein
MQQRFDFAQPRVRDTPRADEHTTSACCGDRDGDGDTVVLDLDPRFRSDLSLAPLAARGDLGVLVKRLATSLTTAPTGGKNT